MRQLLVWKQHICVCPSDWWEVYIDNLPSVKFKLEKGLVYLFHKILLAYDIMNSYFLACLCYFTEPGSGWSSAEDEFSHIYLFAFSQDEFQFDIFCLLFQFHWISFITFLCPLRCSPCFLIYHPQISLTCFSLPLADY